MRIAFITHYTELYGANRSMLGLISGLRAYGTEAFVLVPKEGDITTELKKAGIPWAVFPYESWLTEKKIYPGRFHYVLQQRLKLKKEGRERLKRNKALLPAITKQLKAWNIDLIYSNSSVIHIGHLLSKETGKKHIWHFREMGMLDYKLSPDVSGFFYRRITSSADAVIAVSFFLGNSILKHIPSSKKHVVYNGVISKKALEELAHEPEKKGVGDPFTFALLGVIQEGKGQDTAIRAMAIVARKHKNARLMIAGDGRTEKLSRLAEELGIPGNVSFTGYVPAPLEMMSNADAVLMCSKYEAMGRVTVEAMAVGKPVVGYNGGGTPELIVHEKNGLLYHGEEKELAESMIRLIEDPAWARELGKNGRQSVAEKYTVEAYAKNIYAVLRSVTGI